MYHRPQRLESLQVSGIWGEWRYTVEAKIHAWARKRFIRQYGAGGKIIMSVVGRFIEGTSLVHVSYIVQ